MTPRTTPAVVSLHRYRSSRCWARTCPDSRSTGGVVGDRTWAVPAETGKIGSGKTTKHFTAVRGLLDVDGAAPSRPR